MSTNKKFFTSNQVDKMYQDNRTAQQNMQTNKCTE